MMRGESEIAKLHTIEKVWVWVRYGDENGIKIQWKIEMKGHGGENEIAKPCLIENAKKAEVGWIWR